MKNKRKQNDHLFAILLTLGGLVLNSTSAISNEIDMAFLATDKTNVMQILYGQSLTLDSELIQIQAPQYAENRLVVPISIKTMLRSPESISIITHSNSTPLAAVFFPDPGNSTGETYVGTRIKIARSSKITVIVKSEGYIYSAHTFVGYVTSSGCS